MIAPREFSSFDDAPTNTGTFGCDRDWDEVRPDMGFEEFDEMSDNECAEKDDADDYDWHESDQFD